MLVSGRSSDITPRHPLGPQANVLLSSVFGPYAQDDQYGSRKINPMELYHNQVTRVQGPFSLRIFHRSWGLMFIQANIEAPCTLLDFPTLDRFVEELRRVDYDVVGIGSITINFLKVKKMCELVRQYRPHAQIVVGGHVSNIADLEQPPRRRSHCPRRRGALVPLVPWRRSAASVPPSSDSGPHRLAGPGRGDAGESQRRNGDADPIGGMSDGLQFLRHLVDVRRQREVIQLLLAVPRKFSISCSNLKKR